MPTENRVFPNQSGTDINLDVTRCDLLDDLTIKDFFIIHNGTPYTQLQNYIKTSKTNIRYIGEPLPTTTIEVKRKTPTSIIRQISFGERMSSDLWNRELDRKTRWQEEADLNGVGAVFSGSLPVPQDAAYSSAWDGDVLFPPTRNAVYDIIQTKANINSPALVTPTATTSPTTDNNSLLLATTAYVKNNLSTYAPLSSPAFNGAPTSSTTPPLNSSNSLIPNTAFVQTYDATTQPIGTSNKKVATTEFVNAIAKPIFRVWASNNQTINGSAVIQFNNELTDTNGAWDTSTFRFTVPSGMGGFYLVGAAVVVQASVNTQNVDFALTVRVNGADVVRLDQHYAALEIRGQMLSGIYVLPLNAGQFVDFTLTDFGIGGVDVISQAGQQTAYAYGYRISSL